MRTNEDLVKVRVHLYAIADLDWERIEADPHWDLIAQGFDLTDLEQRKQALFRYLGRYLASEKLFAQQPVYGTNGPSELFITDMEVIANGNSNTA
jgi:hypothetical protein